MRALSIKLLALSPLAVIGLACCTYSSDLPTRKDCIVRINSLDPSKTHFGAGGLKKLMAVSVRQGIPLAGYRVANKKTLYLQYKARCKERIEMSSKIFSYIFNDKKISVDHKKVVPGPNTIDMVGSAWSDGRHL